MDTSYGYTAVDLSRLPSPAVVESLSFESILADMLTDLQVRMAESGQPFTALVESDPAYKVLEVCAFRELLLRQRVNDAARAVMLPYALDSDLDNLGALMDVLRLTLAPADSLHNVPATMESNTDYRHRIQLSPKGFSVAGPDGAYVFHALSADAGVLDASAIGPKPDDIRAIISSVMAANNAPAALMSAMNTALDAAVWPGEVVVTVLARAGDGTAGADLLAKVATSVSADDKRPLTDHVTVKSAQIVPYDVKATIYTFAGPDSSIVMAEAHKHLDAYVADCHRLGRDVTMSGLYAALHVNGVQRVEFTSPTANIVISSTQASFCRSISITWGGVDE